MRQLLLIFTLLCTSYMTVNAQTNTWTGGGGNTNWNTTANWSLGLVPTAVHDVVIPTGFTVNLNVAGATKSIVVQGNSTFNMANNLSILNASSFASNVTVSWTNGSLIGGGTLINNGTLNMDTGGSRYVSGGTTINNTGTVTMPAGGYFYLYDTAVFNNTASGVFDIQSGALLFNSGNTHNFNNAGLFKKSVTNNDAQFSMILTNTGTIAVESGTLTMNTLEKTFNGGVYNVSTGSALILGVNVNVNTILTGLLNGPMNWTNNVSVSTSASFNFTGTAGVTWTSGSLIGGGALTNNGTISLASGGSRYVSGGTTLTNTGLFIMPNAGYFYLYDTSVFNNTASGVFDIQSGALLFNSGTSHNFNNAGLLKKSVTNNDAQFAMKLTNTGTITVDSGTLTMNTIEKTFDGGTYNVATGSQLILGVITNVSGTLTGVLDGAITWATNISVASTATFGFTGTTGIHWNSGFLIGDGLLNNAGTINLTTAGSRYITGTTTLSNTGTITLPSGGYLYLYDNTTLDNQASGVIDFQSDAIVLNNTSGTFNINNSGIIQKTAGTGVTPIHIPTVNSGTIIANSGELEFVDTYLLTNTVQGTIKGTATIDLPLSANYINDGTFAPGGAPGTLTVLGTYKSSATSVLDVELNGLTSGTQYDVLAITGTNAIFDGDVNVTLGFDAAVGNSFTVATTTGTITTKSLTTPFTSDYDGKRYTFNVTYPNDTAVLLTVSARVDIQAPSIITQNVTLQLNASGTATLTPAMVNNGTTDNCSIPADITYSLNMTAFTCANLGANTVTLTATDEANNVSTANATVNVVDAINPTVTCGSDLAVDSSGNYTLPNYSTNSTASASDNCSVTLVQTPAAGTSLADGTHTISFVATDGSGNSANCSFILTVNDTTLSVSDLELSESSIQLYPNPVRDILTLKNINHLELVDAQIMDITGKVISTFDLKHMGLTKEISIGTYANGLYFVKINALTRSITKRIVKE